jgi:lipopolysaccharide export system permease protein
LFPFVLFFSLFQITAKYENNNELIIFWTFGINKLQIINFIFKISIILTMIQIVMSSLIIPKTQDLARSFIKNSKVNFVGNFIKPQRFNDTIKNVTLYSEKKDDKGNLYNLYLKKQQGDTFEISYAKKGEFKLFNNIPVLVLFDGATINGKKDKITNISFSKSDFPINNFESNTATYKKTQEMNSLDLIKCVRYLNTNLKKVENIINCSKNNLSNVYKELYKRFIIPFYIPLLVLVALLIILSSKENINYNKIKIFTFLLGLFFIIFSETTIKMISEIIYNNIMISFLPFLFVIIIYLVFLKKTSFHKLNENLH